MVKLRKVVAVGAAVALVSSLAACSSAGNDGTGDADSDSPVRVVMIASLTGPIATAAKAYVDGMEAAVDVVNGEGGILGRQVELTVLDDQLDPTLGLTLLQRELDKGTPDYVYAGSSSSVALAMLPELSRQRIISVACTGATPINDPETYPYAFGILPSSVLEAEVAAEWVDGLAASSVGILTSDDAQGEGYLDSVIEVLDAEGITHANETYSYDDLDMTAQLQRLQSSDPDALIVQGYGAAAGYYLAGRTRLGIETPTIALALALGTDLSEVSTAADWEGLELTAYPPQVADSPIHERQAWSTLMDTLVENDVTMNTAVPGYLCGWDGLQTYKRGVEQADSFEADEVKSALEDLDAVPDDEITTLMLPKLQYSSTSHFPVLEANEAFALTAPGKTVDGIITPAE